ncbi:PREDICTED: uncharacterized protein LOC106293488 [Brassica oleracea var. oleracea]|uniref:Phorbol-ester/DAG-type domain-containing protein n=1 Tax=Brassica oleracea var. oleracea TaxID=109376 RepID=A0A0D3CMS6_BRAOL|nr:PREDICTED: uncharacterized protein LOC106293488 [Brassica oleracea var. oleracea]
MDTTRSIYKLPIHEHPLLPSTQFTFSTCDGCHVRGFMYGYYFCNEASCYSWNHKECAEAPLEINYHISHPEHPLLLTNHSPTRDDTPCDSCGIKLLSPYYTCATCKFKVDLICGIKPSPSAIEHPVSHAHPLVLFKKREEDEISCEVCKESIGGPFYSCLECYNIFFHVDCVYLSKEVNHPCHFNHPLKIITRESLIYDDAEKYCHLCFMQPKYMLYHCYICNFIVCLGCTKLPPPVVVDHTKTHKHPLRLLSSKVAFTCKLCGVEGCESGPYICIECSFLVHGCCVDLPQVININRHDHPISFSHPLGHGRAKCGVCRQRVRPYYGAYSCPICPNYVVHSRCAIDLTVWNGVKLEGIPDNNEDIAPFKVVGDNLIRHFLHENHNLLFLKDYVMVRDYYEWLRCEACIYPLGFGPIYACQECVCVIHEKCANLPMKKKLVFDPTPYKLEYGGSAYCKLCGIFSGGFKYRSQGYMTIYRSVDVHCGSISEPFVHDGHLHPLYFGKTENHHCDACKRVLKDNMLTCGACNFDLCLYCATLPEKIWHMSDEHPLTLYYGEKADGTNWCEICEMELDPSIWFFTCSDCGVTLHVQCVLGDFSRFKPSESITIMGDKCKAVLNNHSSRPFCRHCHERCKVSIIIKADGEQKNGYICSTSCLLSFFGITQ